jgi:hypothetical protein
MQLIAPEEAASAEDLYRGLEAGDILFFRRMPWPLPEGDQAYLRGLSQTSSAYHKNIAYRPASDRVTGFDPEGVSDPDKLRSIMRAFSLSVLEGLRSLLPRYMDDCRVDYASFRSVEEEGRNLSFNKRNDLLHIDAFPTRPTGGDLILRTFVNINPARSRVWLTSDPFEPLARQYAGPAGWAKMARPSVLARLFARRSPYDRFMLRFHDYLKRNEEYQKNSAKYRWEFPPGSAWIVFTDIVPHAVISGQYALEQTVIVRREKLLSPERAPIAILNRLVAESAR